MINISLDQAQFELMEEMFLTAIFQNKPSVKEINDYQQLLRDIKLQERQQRLINLKYSNGTGKFRIKSKAKHLRNA